MATLLEKWSKNLQVSENVYSRDHENEKLSQLKKVCIATCLNNTAKFLNESLDSSTATQRADLGDYKRFCLNLTTVALPY